LTFRLFAYVSLLVIQSIVIPLFLFSTSVQGSCTNV